MKKAKRIIAVLLASLGITSFAGCNLADETEKMADGATKVYNSVEKFFVDGYGKVEDKFIEWFFAKDGETVEQAKDRLNKNK